MCRSTIVREEDALVFVACSQNSCEISPFSQTDSSNDETSLAHELLAGP